jgi:hypothetical protein
VTNAISTEKKSPLTGEAVGREPGRTVADIEVFLREDHDMMATLAENILKQITGGDREDVARAITSLQVRLGEHLDMEERELLPGYARLHPDDAAHILTEHRAFRKALAELDMATDLHLVRAEALRAFLGTLRAHAVRENAGLYRWALTASETSNA